MPAAATATETPAKLAKRVPQRTCVACRTTGGKRGLLRVVRLPKGAGVVYDATGKTNGRGAYVCKTEACIALAVKQKKLERSLKCPVSPETVDALKTAAIAATAQREPESVKQAEPGPQAI